MRIGFTGTRVGMSSAQKKELRTLMERLMPTEFHHGDCLGADAEAVGIVTACTEATIHTHPPIDAKARAFISGGVLYKERPYLERNCDIVNNSDLLIAAPMYDNEITRSGTWATVRYARFRKKPIMRLRRNGGIAEERR